MICTNCGAKCAETNKFCPICGHSFDTAGASSNDAGSQNGGFAAPASDVQGTSSDTTQGYGSQSGYQNYYNSGSYQNPNPNPNPGYYRNDYNPSELTEDTLPDNLKPLSPWAYLGYYCLFNLVPCAGIILAFVFAFSQGENVNRRNFARFYLIMLAISFILSLLLVFTIIAVGGSIGELGRIFY